jgi:hypothetical protein
MFHALIFAVNNYEMARTSGPYRIATHLREQGWDVEVLDFFDFWSIDELKEFIKSRITKNTKFIGFSSIFGSKSLMAENSLQIIEWIKKIYPNIILITGGQNFSVPEKLKNFIDYHIVGYGEYALDSLLKYKFSNGDKLKFDVMKSKKNFKVINAIHSYPAFPMRDPIIKYEDRDFIILGEWGTIEFSRGCKFKCSFCNFPVLGVKGDYTRTSESVQIQMLDAYDRFGIKDYLVTDETFNDTTEKISKFANVVEKLPWKPYFSGFIRADLLISRPKDREELLRMGFLGHFYGIETFNPLTAKSIKKGYDPEKIKKGLIELKKYFGKNYRSDINFIAGLPHETIDSLEKTKEWLFKNYRDQCFGAYTLEINNLFDSFNLSEIDNNWQNLGYEKMSEEEILLKNFSKEKIDRCGNTDGEIILWKNKNMNIFEANDWVEDLSKGSGVIKNKFLYKKSTFQLRSIIVSKNQELLTTEKKINSIFDTKDDQKYFDNFKNIFVKNYIQKKLNL